jgi:RNA polymerase sigma-70 factor, ECF subfamily
MGAISAIARPRTGGVGLATGWAREDDEGRLLAALAGGDREAAERLVELTYRRIFALLFRLTGGDAEAAADLTQETYRKAWGALDTFAGGARLSTWLFRIAYTTFLNHLRRPHRVVAVDDLEAAAAAGAADPDPAPSAEEVLVRAREGERLRRSVLALPADLRDTVAARFWGEQPVAEIARREGLTAAAVRKRLRKAMGLLAQALEASS